jgi:transcription elongation factor
MRPVLCLLLTAALSPSAEAQYVPPPVVASATDRLPARAIPVAVVRPDPRRDPSLSEGAPGRVPPVSHGSAGAFFSSTKGWWTLAVTAGAAQAGDLTTTWDALARCPACREGNALLADRADHPNFAWIAGAKLGTYGLALATKRKWPRFSTYLLGSLTVFGGVAIAINTTAGKGL